MGKATARCTKDTKLLGLDLELRLLKDFFIFILYAAKHLMPITMPFHSIAVRLYNSEGLLKILQN